MNFEKMGGNINGLVLRERHFICNAMQQINWKVLPSPLPFFFLLNLPHYLCKYIKKLYWIFLMPKIPTIMQSQSRQKTGFFVFLFSIFLTNCLQNKQCGSWKLFGIFFIVKTFLIEIGSHKNSTESSFQRTFERRKQIFSMLPNLLDICVCVCVCIYMVLQFNMLSFS